MRMYSSQDGLSGFWLGPAFLGVLLILLGLLLYAMPELLAYVVAAIFILAGCGLLGAAWRMRRQVTYRQIDREWPADDPQQH